MNGAIGFSSNKIGLFPKLIRAVTRSRWSHCFIYIDDVLGEKSVIEASDLVQVVPFSRNYVKNPHEEFQLFEIVDAKADKILEALNFAYCTYSGASYGFLELPFFILRNFLNKNPIHKGVICSELLIRYIQLLDGDHAQAMRSLDAESSSVEDIYRIVISRPDLFKRIDNL